MRHSSIAPGVDGTSRASGSIAASARRALAVAIIAAAGALTACGDRVEGQVTYEAPAGGGVVVEDEYDYYPDYGVYYNGYRHQYLYLEGGAWVARPAPPGVSVDVFLRSPHVHMGFHDHPRFHHEEMVRRYPGHEHYDGHVEERHEERHEERR